MLNYSNVTATLAVFIALGGSSYAAVSLKSNSVKSGHIGTGQVKGVDLARNAVTTAHVRDGSLLARDFRPGQLRAANAGPGGPAGSQGPAGAQGPTGASGPAGPSGVVDVLGFDGTWSPQTLPGNLGGSIVNPQACRTSSHQAGVGEVAVIALEGTGSPNAAANDVLYINAMVGVNGAALKERNASRSAESLIDGTAHPTINLRYELEAGKSYVFGAGFATNAQQTISPGWCQGTVTIVREGK